MDVPRDFSNLGIDDTAIATHIWPPLTTVRWPIVSIGRAAGCKLIHPEPAGCESALFRPELIRRASVKPERG